jgi:hypothetical protein
MQERKSRSEWAVVIAEQTQSGLSKIKFCQQRGISISRFNYYQKLLKMNENKENSKDVTASTSPMIPIQIKNHTPKYAEKECHIKLILKNGLECILPSTIDKKSLKEIVEVLTSC